MGYPLLVIGIAVALPFRNHVAMGRGNPVGDVVSQPRAALRAIIAKQFSPSQPRGRPTFHRWSRQSQAR
jgi:hypothetical protein